MLKTSFQDNIYSVQINRPEARNALNRELREGLAQALGDVPQGARLVRLMGVPEAFCSGQDLSEFDENADVSKIMNHEYKPIIDAIEALDIPVVAGVEGACAGAGVSLALAADMVVASDEAFFQIAFARVGLVPDISVSYLLPRLIGSARAMGMALSGARIAAKDAQSWGMIWQIFPAENFQSDFDAWCLELAQGASFALGRTRKLMRQSWRNDPDTQFALEREYQVEAAASRDFEEGVRAFLEKRLAKFEGR